MAARPLLVFPIPGVSDRTKLGGGPQHTHYPSAARQAERLGPQIQRVEAAFEARRAGLAAQIGGADPEKVLVLETVGTITDFINAVRRIPGMEWLAEIDEEGILGDADFFDSENAAKPLGGRLFLIMTNQGALQEMLRLWNTFQQHPEERFARGFGKWRSLFKQLRNIRVWGVEDRLRETGLLSVWEEELALNERTFRFEAELWFRGDEERRRRSMADFRGYLEQQGGAIVGETLFPEIAYHAVIGEVPPAVVQAVVAREELRLLQCEDVMFFRPTGQALVPLRAEGAAPGGVAQRVGPSDLAPLAALLDGIPIENHTLLAGRLVVDDPDGWGADYPARERQHGTAMASLILHGDLNLVDIPSRHSLYVRPVMRPDKRDWRESRVESMPRESFPPDLLRRVLRRMFEDVEGSNATAPTVRVINLSVGDTSRPYDQMMSAFARAVDWLSWKYRVTFLLSAGNHSRTLELDTTNADFPELDVDQTAQQCFTAVLQTAHLRRLLSPAESVNALTIGGIHDDGAAGALPIGRVNPYSTNGFPSAYNAVGSGFRRAIKPDLLVSGGRQLFSRIPGAEDARVRLDPVLSVANAPGHRTAASSATPGEVNATRFTRGTSNATALATRSAVTVADMIAELGIASELSAVTIKCLLAHGCSWGAYDFLRQVLEAATPGLNVREQLARFLGYGNLDLPKVLSGTERRVTVIGTSEIAEGQGHIYRFPLPPSLSGVVGERRLIVTLAWLSPINPLHRNYRTAALWFNFPTGQTLQVDRVACDYHAVQRGTLQHEIFQGSQAVAYGDNTVIEVKINCREDGGKLIEQIPYCVAVTMEVAPGIPVAVYDEVRARLQLPVVVHA